MQITVAYPHKKGRPRTPLRSKANKKMQHGEFFYVPEERVRQRAVGWGLWFSFLYEEIIKGDTSP